MSQGATVGTGFEAAFFNMSSRVISFFLLLAASAWLSVLSVAGPAHALQQPNGARIPSAMGCDSGQPTGLASVLACECDVADVCNIGAACPGNVEPNSCDQGQNATCESTIWHAWNDDSCVPSNISGLDPWTEAAVTPETFTPTCPLTFTVLTRGTAQFKDAFGWYNVTGTKPSSSELYVMLDCNTGAGARIVLDVQSDSRYLGGEIGFFLLTPEDHSSPGRCAGGDCCAAVDRLSATVGRVYYSERRYNPDASGDQSLIHLLTLNSRLQDRKFYFAWEDIFNASNNDFTDIVTSVEGVECSGGGERCDTGEAGICGVGLTTCRSGELECVGTEQAGGEVCDGLDNDCDGVVDDDATCPNDEVCNNGRCLPSCELGEEFACPAFAVCDNETGRCIDPDCVGVTCTDGAICRGGDCVTPCDGIVCPVGTTCRQGACVDPCQNVACDPGEVCREGICFGGCSDCAGIVCAAGFICAVDTGDCEDPSCPNGCPTGSYCDEGNCVDRCDGAVCPAGEVCMDGRCCRGDQCDVTAGEADAGVGGADGGGPGVDTPGGGCCRVAGESQWPRGTTVLLMGFVLLGLRRRRRRAP